MPDRHGTKGMWVDWMLEPCSDFQLWPHPWPGPWIFNVKFWNCCIPGMAGSIDMEQKGYESIGCYTYFVTLSYDLDLGFSRSNFKNAYLGNGRADWHGTKGMWVDRMLDSLCDFELWPHAWPWIFKVSFINSCISGMGGPINMEWKGYESIGCYSYHVTLAMTLTLDFEGQISKIYHRNKRVYWHKRIWIHRMQCWKLS